MLEPESQGKSTISPETDDLRKFADQLNACLRDNSITINNLFISFVIMNDARRNIRMHILKSDPNNRPQVGTLVRVLATKVLDYCIPRKIINKALADQFKTQSTARLVSLYFDAKQLFTDLTNSGEGGELLLFILTESILKYPQALSKMSLKTSPKMHFHGLDGIYISCLGSPPILNLHFGESKLHKDANTSLKEAIHSIAKMLTDEGFRDSARTDIYLLNTHVDLGDSDLEDALRGFLDPNDQRYRAPNICAVLLSGHELQDYPIIHNECDIPKTLGNITEKLITVLEKNAAATGIKDYHIDLFLVPFPNLEEFRHLLKQELGL